MPFSHLWGRITGADKGLKVPNQQVSSLGRLGDSAIASPYGLYANLPADTLLKEIASNVFVSVTEERPSDTEQGEPVFFHPATNTRIIARNNGDLDISTVSASITASGSVTIDTPIVTLTGDVQIDGALNVNGQDYMTHSHAQGNDSDNDSQVNTGGVV